MEQKRVPHYKFMLTANGKSVYAIRVIVKDVEYIVEPYQIFNTIYSRKRYFLLYLNEEEYCTNKATLRVDTEIKDDNVCWHISSVDKPNCGFNIFARSNYVGDIDNVLEELLVKIKNGEPVLYNNKRNHYYKYNLQNYMNRFFHYSSVEHHVCISSIFHYVTLNERVQTCK